ncbi:Alanine acetyltransferase [Flavobacterium sp. 9AF]|uniref:GNAT family N-acetyltransferase n=1 Tax=Flavobacterium sp. 9AF TaxID=2653142 RepID=UPI0012F01F25|nr:GNAT family N-acetyltransferase [Flavobacterium sp. 9AF]VXB66471.1 Alanine acetyltransferase [Flavobacterium sp. 9AF]
MLQLNFSPFPILESERLHFRALQQTDVNEIFALRSNPELMQYIPRPLVTNLEEAMAHIKMIQDKVEANEAINWAVTEKGKDKLISLIGFYRTELDNYRSEIGYMLLPEYQNKGYITEAIQILLNYGFGQMGLHSVEAIIDPRNIASAKVLEKNGFKKEAHFIENCFHNGEFLDSVHYSLLKKHHTSK